jgi:hypothetical protein
LDKKRASLQKGRAIDEVDLTELIQSYQKYLLLTHTTIFWNPKTTPKFIDIEKFPSPTSEEYWTGRDTQAFFNKMSSIDAQARAEWTTLLDARVKLKSIIGSSGLQQVEDLTFIKRGPALPPNELAIAYNAQYPDTGSPYFKLLGYVGPVPKNPRSEEWQNNGQYSPSSTS